MGLFSSSGERGMRLENVCGSLDLERVRGAARALGILDDRRYVHHLREGGRGADFELYWVTKFEPLVRSECS